MKTNEEIKKYIIDYLDRYYSVKYSSLSQYERDDYESATEVLQEILDFINE